MEPVAAITNYNNIQQYTLKTGIPVGEGNSILKLLWRISRPEIQLVVGFYGIYFSSQKQIAYFLTQEAVYLLVHFKFLRVYLQTVTTHNSHVGLWQYCGFEKIA